MTRFSVRELVPEETYALRRSVGRGGGPGEVTYLLDSLAEAFHLGAVDTDGHVVAISSYYPEPCPIQPDALRPVRLRFMAMDPAVQRAGVGSAVLSEALRRLRATGATLLWATARNEAVPFYERFGFSVHRQGHVSTSEATQPIVVLDLGSAEQQPGAADG